MLRRAFTIVELMVCAMIISILVAFAAVGISRTSYKAELEKATAHTEILNGLVDLYMTVSSPSGRITFENESALLTALHNTEGLLPSRIKSLLGNPPSLGKLNKNLSLSKYEIGYDKTCGYFETKEKQLNE